MSVAIRTLFAALGLAWAAQAMALSVSITAPANNAIFAAGGSITLSTTAKPTNAKRPITKVEFFRGGSTLIGTAAATPYSILWSAAPAGTYSITAKATDSRGATATSTAITVKVDALPSVSLSAPSNGSLYLPGSTINLAATASDSDGTVSKVEFFQGATLLGTATTAPYSFAWTNVPGGSYSLTARATDNNNFATTSAVMNVVVTAPPTISVTSPANNAVLAAPADIAITASATDPDGTIAKVEFFDGATLVGTATAAPYSYTITNAAIGSHSLIAKATDNQGSTTTSAAVTVIVDTAPGVSLTSPTPGATYAALADVAISASASDPDGTISRVEFYSNGSLITTLSAAPYSFTWSNVPAGTYALSAKAIDNNNIGTMSATVSITVNSHFTGPALYFIHPDHLNTPRLVADAMGTTVWRWDQQEPFGDSVPDNNPSGLGAFDFALKFPGQYADKESSISYNFYRDYDPASGRYVESDPIGVRVDLNTYLYVGGLPLQAADFFGLFPVSVRNFTMPPGDAGCGSGKSGPFTPNLFFENCCDGHDACYGSCEPRPSKDSCDRAFADCTLSQCSRRWIGVKFACEYAAVIYAEAVRRGGDDAYNRASAKCAAAGRCKR